MSLPWFINHFINLCFRFKFSEISVATLGNLWKSSLFSSVSVSKSLKDTHAVSWEFRLLTWTPPCSSPACLSLSLRFSLSSGTLGLRWMVSTAQTDWFMGVRFACRPPEDPPLHWLRSRACLPHPEDSKALPWLCWCQTPNGHFSTTPICHRGRLGSSLKQEEKKEIERASEEKK